ncbi:MAG: efflux RND transporter permease subunit, partial [Myxococcota bacterium]|nr:efflux RND transporter permease subunit [Myxococcota bacterium]
SLEKAGKQLEEVLREIPSVRSETVFAERVVGKPYLEIRMQREELARHGLSVEDVQRTLQIALSGRPLTTLLDGRERYDVRVRYQRDSRQDIEALGRLLVPTKSGRSIPLEQLTELAYVKGPQAIKSEDTFLTSYVIFDHYSNKAELEVVEEVRQIIEAKRKAGELELPAGIKYDFAGNYKNQVRSADRLAVLVPLALLLIFLVLHLQFSKISTTAIIYTGVAVAVSGGFVLMWFYQQPWFMDFSVAGHAMREVFQIRPTNLSVAVWVGTIALVGIATDDGVVMATYLDQRFARDKPETIEEIRDAVLEAGKRRVRPCLMTTATTLLALLPVITSTGRGSDVMIPMAIPSIGGMAVELITLFVVPVLYCSREELRHRF